MVRLIPLLLPFMLVACASPDRHIQPSDIDTLTGRPWVGSLTYLDYASRKPVTIDSSLIVKRIGDTPTSWEFGTGYSKEPHADSKEVISLNRDGSMLGDEQVVSRTTLPRAGILIVTECDGEDDHRPARFRFEHSITDHEYARRKLVRFKGDSDFFERHVYRWSR